MSWQNKSLLYLVEVCEAFLTSQSLTGTVELGIPAEGLPTATSEFDLFLSNLNGYPSYEDDLLKTGHIIATRYKQVSRASMQSDTSDIIDDLLKYIRENIANHSPDISGVSSEWLWISDTNIEGYEPEESAFDNAIKIEIVFTNGVNSP